jgi:hypothetical protein
VVQSVSQSVVQEAPWSAAIVQDFSKSLTLVNRHKEWILQVALSNRTSPSRMPLPWWTSP